MGVSGEPETRASFGWGFFAAFLPLGFVPALVALATVLLRRSRPRSR